MSAREDAERVKKLVFEGLFIKRKAAVYAISLRYAALAIQYFYDQQSSGKYWENRTNQAKDRMFTRAFQYEDVIGWFMAHGVYYGVYLELSNDRRNEAIRPIVQRYAGRFFRDVQAVFKDGGI